MMIGEDPLGDNLYIKAEKQIILYLFTFFHPVWKPITDIFRTKINH